MSDMHIERYPTSDDTVSTADPVNDVTVPEPNEGNDHFDPRGESITHIGSHGRGRQPDGHDWFETAMDLFRGRRHADPDAAFGIGTEEHPSRELRDEALQVRQLQATSFTTNQVVIPIGDTSVSIASSRRERLGIVLYNLGTVTVFISPHRTGVSVTGFPLVAGATMTLTVLGGINGSVGAGSSAAGLVAVMDQFRTDNRGN